MAASWINVQGKPKGAEIVSLAVHPDCRRRGLAVALISHIMRKLGVSSVVELVHYSVRNRIIAP